MMILQPLHVPPDDSRTTTQAINVDIQDAEYADPTDDAETHGMQATTSKKTDWVRIWTMGLFAVTCVLLFADQNLLAPNLTAAADEFGFDNEERDDKLGGRISFAFFVLGAPASVVFGCLADSYRRTPLFALTVFVGEGACMATYWTTTYGQFYVCRALTGFSVGGALPLIYSILGDCFPAGERPMVAAVIGMGTGCGIAIGQTMAGFVGPRYGWRLPFLLVSVPALTCAMLVLTTVEEPERGGKEEAFLMNRDEGMASPGGAVSDRAGSYQRVAGGHKDEKHEQKSDSADGNGYTSADESFGEDAEPHNLSHNVEGANLSPDRQMRDPDRHQQPTGRPASANWSATLQSTRSLVRTPSFVLLVLQGAPGCVPWGVVSAFLNDYLAQDRGMTVEKATFTVLCFGVGCFLGMGVGGAFGRILYLKRKAYPNILCGISVALGVFPMWLMINRIDDSTNMAVLILTSVTAGILPSVPGPIVKATLQNVTHPTNRGQAFAWMITFDDVGKGLGPVFVAALIAKFGGRKEAFNFGLSGWVLCGVANVLVSSFVEKDERRAQAVLASAIQWGHDIELV